VKKLSDEVKITEQDLAYIQSEFSYVNSLPRQLPEYVVLPPDSSRKRGGRLLKRKDENFYLVKDEELSEDEKYIIRKFDVEYFGDSYLLEDVLKRKELLKKLEEMREKLNIVLFPKEYMKSTLIRIGIDKDGNLKKIPLAFMTKEQISFVSMYDRLNFGSDEEFWQYYQYAINLKKELEDVYGVGAFLKKEYVLGDISEIYHYIDGDIFVVKIYKKSDKIINGVKVRLEVYRNDKLIYFE
jgi:hypothetical protein